jgi:molybdopterin-containing oxidoreductase family membrane subunit
MIEKALKGGRGYWAWICFLLAVVAAGFVSYLYQCVNGLSITGLSRSVSWGLYIANFTFFVGVAASAVTVVLPYYLHNVREFQKITILGEFLAVSAVIMSLLFIIVDLGRPDRAFNLILYPSPDSLLFWDMIVLSGYLVVNLLIGWSTLDAEQKGEKPLPWVRVLILLSIPWAVSIHTVTAFIYQGLVARPLWHTPLWAPRFLASAFSSGPALLILMVLFIKRVTLFDAGTRALHKVATIATYALLVNIFLLLVELFTTLYGRVPADVEHLRYLFVGIDGHSALVPWMWLSMVLMGASALVLLSSRLRQREGLLAATCVAIFLGVWIDKGLGLVIPGFIPSPLGELIEYSPTLPEILITTGVWAVGFLIISLLYRVAVAVKLETESADAKPVIGP